MKTYIALVRDHSASMGNLATDARNDYNLTIQGIKESMTEGQNSFVTVVECGVGPLAQVRVQEDRENVLSMKELTSYSTSGSGTPLWDSVGEAIARLEAIERTDFDYNTAYLVMVVTDGEENRSRFWTANKIAAKISEKQKTDRWTFAFRVPRGAASTITRVGIPAGNVMEWEQTTAALQASTQATVSATKSYFATRSTGGTSVGSFYANVADLTVRDVVETLKSVSVMQATVKAFQDGIAIKDFCINSFGRYDLGRGFYQLSKSETVQESKQIILFDKVSGLFYTGSNARSLLGLPLYGSITLRPGMNGNYDIFIQSTSTNRKLVSGTRVLYL